MRFSLSTFAIAAAAVTSVAFVVGAVYALFFYEPFSEAELEQLILEAQRQSAAAVSRTVQVHLLGEGRLSYANEEMTFETFASHVEREGWDSQVSVQVLIASPGTGEDNVRLLELLARRGVFHVRILPPVSTAAGQP